MGTSPSQNAPSTTTVPGQTPPTEPVAPPPPAFPENVQRVLDRFAGSWVPDWRYADGMATVAVPAEQIVDVVRFLRFENTPRFDLLIDICGAHWPSREAPFEVTYILHSLATNQRIRLKVNVAGEEPSIPTITSIWAAANWPEREIWDMFGVTFTGHPDLRRLLSPNDWEGHSLRKDFPLGEEPIEFYRQPTGPTIGVPAGGDINPTLP